MVGWGDLPSLAACSASWYVKPPCPPPPPPPAARARVALACVRGLVLVWALSPRLPPGEVGEDDD